MAISSDGKYIAAGCESEKILLFEKSSSTPLWSYSASYKVATVAISSDGEYIAAGTWDGYVYLSHKSSSIPMWNRSIGSDQE